MSVKRAKDFWGEEGTEDVKFLEAATLAAFQALLTTPSMMTHRELAAESCDLAERLLTERIQRIRSARGLGT